MSPGHGASTPVVLLPCTSNRHPPPCLPTLLSSCNVPVPAAMDVAQLPAAAFACRRAAQFDVRPSRLESTDGRKMAVQECDAGTIQRKDGGSAQARLCGRARLGEADRAEARMQVNLPPGTIQSAS
eukprot:Amastigsp_a511359_54.p6 type:complete len:126 gc:universal Amastigsp_a511359_54:760-383(-)